MKKYLALMLCGLMGVGCASNKTELLPPTPPQTNNQQNLDWKEIKGDTWSVQVPKYFMARTDTFASSSVAGMEFLMTDESYDTMLLLQKSPTTQNLLEFSTDFTQALKQQEGLKILDVEDVKINNQKSVAIISSYQNSIYTITYIVVSSGSGYSLSCAAPTEKMSKKVYLCEKIANTLTVK